MSELISACKSLFLYLKMQSVRFAAALILSVGLVMTLSFAHATGANSDVPPAKRLGPASLPADLATDCVSSFETPVVETYLQGWRRAGLKVYDCAGLVLSGRDATAALGRLPARGPLPIEAVSWDKGLYGIRLAGRLYFFNEDDAIRVGIEPRAFSASKGGMRGLAVTPASALIDGPPPQDARIHQVQVFYGTDRQRATKNSDTMPVRYLNTRGTTSFGTATVTLPPRHERGALERPAWWRLEFVADPAKHVTFKAATPALSRDSFLADVRAVVATSQEKQIFVFVHGFNTGFEAAALRTAQMHHDLSFDGAPIFWSWASKARPDPMAYFADTRAAAQTVDELSKFLTMVAQETGATRVHVIAHSMGNQATVRALDQIATNSGGARALFDQVVLCSPDVDREEFERIATRINTTARRTTLYASANDRALQVSEILNGGLRLGDARGGVVTKAGLESVDASKVTTDLFGLNHTFFSTVPSVMVDLRTVLSSPALPKQRGLVEVQAPEQGLPWWAIP